MKSFFLKKAFDKKDSKICTKTEMRNIYNVYLENIFS